MSKLKPEAQRRKRRRQYQRALPQIEALYEELHQRFPNTFFREPAKVSPLKKGIYHDIKDAFSDSTYNTRIIDWTLNRYTRRYSYLQALGAGKPRIDLSGNPTGIVTEEEQQEAIAQLKTQRRRREKSRKVYYKAGKQAEGTSLASNPSDGAVTEDQAERQPTPARRKTTKNGEDNV